MADSATERISSNKENLPEDNENIVSESVDSDKINSSNCVDTELAEDIVLDNCSEDGMLRRRSSDDLDLIERVNHSKRLKIAIDSQSSSSHSPDSKHACFHSRQRTDKSSLLPQETLTTRILVRQVVSDRIQQFPRDRGSLVMRISRDPIRMRGKLLSESIGRKNSILP